MLEKPAITDAKIFWHLQEVFGVVADEVAFLPMGNDASAGAYRIRSGHDSYFLKVRQGVDNPSIVELAGFLADAGPTHVLAPRPAVDGRRFATVRDLSLVLYPFVEGANAFDSPLTESLWVALGGALRAVHDVVLPTALREPIRVEVYVPKWRDKVRGHLATRSEPPLDAVAQELLHVLAARHDQISTMIVDRAEELAKIVRTKAPEIVLCHSDVHAGNIIVGNDGPLTIVDWDDPIMAPKERDLMFIGGGVGTAWNKPDVGVAFYRGYGHTVVDPPTLAYYRYERIVEDVALYSDALLLNSEGRADRRRSLENFCRAFDPGNVVDMADRTYRAL